MARGRERLTYRVRHLPTYLQKSEVAAFLTRMVQGLGSSENVQIFSLASSLSPWEKPPSKTATLVFKETPRRFDNDQDEWAVGPVADQVQSLIFDTHFLEFTPLNDVDPNVHQFDCIAISGLASHPFGSWKQRGQDSNFMWLRDRLPTDMPYIRAIIYGYDTKLVESESFQTVDDLALSFIRKMRSIGRTSLTAKPLVIIAHSLGGIVLKRALMLMANSSDAEDFILKAIRMTFFFGVPNRGMSNFHLLMMVKGQPNEALVRTLSPDSSYLEILNKHFAGIALHYNIRLICAYETKRSQTTEMTSSQQWKRSGPYEALLDRDSAIQSGSQASDVFPINEDHSNMVKFSEDDADYRIVVAYLHELQSKPAAAPAGHHAKAPPMTRKFKLKDLLRKHEHKNSGPTPAASAELFLAPLMMAQAFSAPNRGLVGPVSSEKVLRLKRELEIQNLTESLSFAEIDYRLKEISEAYSATFDWIFENKELGFFSWLRDDRNIYWIRGKPGSGKSTFMKFLHKDPRCAEGLGRWRHRKHICAWFFFHDRGSHVQKSFEGLLRAVLRQVITQEPALAKHVLAVYHDREDNGRDIWPIEDLEKALIRILDQNELQIDIVLFIDALDEYDGPPELIAEFLSSITKNSSANGTRVKVCFSSRPWDAFVDKFDHCSGFQIHDQTRSDIYTYCSNELMSIEHIKLLLSSEDAQDRPNSQGLVSTIADRAEGVILWVKLVVQRLQSASLLSTMEDLKTTLLDIPDNLEELYERTVERIPKSHRLEAFIFLELVQRSPEPRTIQHLVAAASCALCLTWSDCIGKVEQSRGVDSTSKSLEVKLKNLCGGLIEVVHTDSRSKVQFMHQTVKDFVSKPGFEQRILGHSHAPLFQNGYSFWMKYELTFPEAGGHSRENVIELAHLAESTTGKSQRFFLETVPRDVFTENFREKGGEVKWVNSLMTFAVAADLRLFLTEILERYALQDLPGQESSMPLLHCAVFSSIWNRINGPLVEFPLLGVVQLLLSRGSDVSVKFEGQTPFQALLQRYWGKLQYANIQSCMSSDMVNIAVVLLQNGQNPNCNIGARAWFCGHDFDKAAVTCSALHISALNPSQVAMTRTLLECGAEVNSLNSIGQTALDILITRQKKRSETQELPQAFEMMSILLERGGGITGVGKDSLEAALETFESYRTLPEIFRSPPILVPPARQGIVEGLLLRLPAFFGGQSTGT